MTVRNDASPARARQEKAREQARRDILLAAAAVFAERGYVAATLTEIAQAAGFAAPSLYRYFGSKEEIFRSLVDLIKAELHATFDAPVDPGLPVEGRLVALVTAQLELTRSRRALMALLLTSPDVPGRSMVVEARAGMTLYERAVAGWLGRHVAPGELRCEPAVAARVLAAIGHAFHHAHIADPTTGIDPAAEAVQIVDLALRGIAATPAAPPAPRSTT